MSKVSKFYADAMTDEAVKNKLIKILGGKNFEDANDEQLAKIGEIAKELGFDITIEDAKTYLRGEDLELDEDDLDAVAGGKNDYSIVCVNEVGHSA